jgi:hypothetical protein
MKYILRKGFQISVLLLTITPVLLGANKYALVVGIDKYPGERKLEGSVNDAKAVAELLKEKGFTDIRMLTDDEATRDGILAALRRFQTKAKAGDLFFFYFAGHGTVFPDRLSKDQDEGNRMIKGEIRLDTGKPSFPEGAYDSAICPVDHKHKTSSEKWGNLILDDELSTEFAEFTAKGSGVLFVSDSCNSGTLGRKLDAPNTRFLSPAEAYDLPIEGEMDRKQPSQAVNPIDKKKETLKGKFLALTAAADQQNAEEFEDNNRKMWGVFTYYFLEILREKPEITFEELQRELNNRTPRKNRRQQAQIETRFFLDVKKAKFFYPF